MYGPALTQQTLLQKARFHDRAFSFLASMVGKQSKSLCRNESICCRQTTAGCTAVTEKSGIDFEIVSIGRSAEEHASEGIGGTEDLDRQPLRQRLSAGDT